MEPLKALRARLALPGANEEDPNKDARGRLTRVEDALLTAAAGDGLLHIRRFARERAGRIHALDVHAQQVPNILRPWISASAHHRVLIDVDLVNAHARIAGEWFKRLGDPTLADDLAATLDFYSDVAVWLLEGRPVAPGFRRQVKASVLAILNGGDASTIAENLRDHLDAPAALAAGERLIAAWRERYPVWDHLVAQVKEEARRAGRGGVVCVPTLIDTEVEILLDSEPERSWRTLLSARWTAVEVAVLEYTLLRLHDRVGHLGAAIVLPLHDGVLLDTPWWTADRVAQELVLLMEEAARASGVPGVRAEAEVQERWGAPLRKWPK